MIGRPFLLLIEAGHPIHRDERLGRNELPIGAVENVEHAALGRLHDHLTSLAFDLNIGHDEAAHGVQVPGVAGDRLVIPLQLAGFRIHGND